MVFTKFFLSLSASVLLILFLGQAHLIGESESYSKDENGQEVKTASTQKFIPPLGKILSPFHGFWQNAESVEGAAVSDIQNETLKQKVEVCYDNRMVPHIFAQNDHDLFFVQGYVTASLRLWQMELQTHEAAGRLCEFMGTTDVLKKVLLKRDMNTRREGLLESAKRSVEYWRNDPEKIGMLDAYTAGVNAYIESLTYSELPLMYKLQDYRPEKWTNLKTALLMKSMGKILTGRNHDFQYTNMMNLLGKEKFKALYTDYFDQQSPIILDSMIIDLPSQINSKDSIQFFNAELLFQRTQDEMQPKGVGSNNWAVSGTKTNNGFPILCNDPHLKLNLPSIWFEIQLVSPGINAYGASLPGAPGVISGFNENIAWGVTNVSHDVKDWYHINWKDETTHQYWFDSTYLVADEIIEAFKIRDGLSVMDTILWTKMGPIAKVLGDHAFALRWTLHDPSDEPLTFYKLMKAKHYQDYLDAIQHFSCPAQNLVFAAKDGDIALWTQGKLPLRKSDQGKFIQEAVHSNQMWEGFIPQQHIPHEHNPSKGFVASANQHSIDPSKYPYEYYGYFEEYRGRYLNRRLQEMDRITIEDMKKLQFDAYSMRAEDFMGFLKTNLNTGSLTKDELEVWHILKDWNHIYGAEQEEPVIFEAFMVELYSTTFDELIDLAERSELVYGDDYLLPEEYTLISMLSDDTDYPIFDIIDTEEKENKADLITYVFKKTASRFYQNGELFINQWAKQRATKIQHLSRIDAFSQNQIHTDGHPSTLNALSGRPGPSWKMIVELGDHVNAYGIYPGGQSGNPGSHFYDNMIESWSKGEHYKLLIMNNPGSHDDKVVMRQNFN